MPLRWSVDYMTDSGARSLAAAVCLQAIKDYDRLCDMLARGKIREDDRGNLVPGPTFHRSHYIGKKRYGETLPNYSFAEIERFFPDEQRIVDGHALGNIRKFFAKTQT